MKAMAKSQILGKNLVRYAQTEREGLGVVWACERLHYYLFGAEFNNI